MVEIPPFVSTCVCIYIIWYVYRNESIPTAIREYLLYHFERQCSDRWSVHMEMWMVLYIFVQIRLDVAHVMCVYVLLLNFKSCSLSSYFRTEKHTATMPGVVHTHRGPLHTYECYSYVETDKIGDQLVFGNHFTAFVCRRSSNAPWELPAAVRTLYSCSCQKAIDNKLRPTYISIRR